jgi:NAD(P)-dependent dehydrogenase (short-subunit alcohol dehydrogenase family)
MSDGVDIAGSTNRLPIPRAGEPEEVAKAMLYFVTEATYSTGTKLYLDGGSLLGTLPG